MVNESQLDQEYNILDKDDEIILEVCYLTKKETDRTAQITEPIYFTRGYFLKLANLLPNELRDLDARISQAREENKIWTDRLDYLTIDLDGDECDELTKLEEKVADIRKYENELKQNSLYIYMAKTEIEDVIKEHNCVRYIPNALQALGIRYELETNPEYDPLQKILLLNTRVKNRDELDPRQNIAIDPSPKFNIE
jgi:hypothetical protein